MGTKRGHKRGENSLRYQLGCEWCAALFMCTRPDAQTCQNKCRQALAKWRKRWRARFGNTPLFGPRGVKEQQTVAIAVHKPQPARSVKVIDQAS